MISKPDNYRAALERAVQWLGDRYLLARPINARRDTPRRVSKPERRQATP